MNYGSSEKKFKNKIISARGCDNEAFEVHRFGTWKRVWSVSHYRRGEHWTCFHGAV